MFGSGGQTALDHCPKFFIEGELENYVKCTVLTIAYAINFVKKHLSRKYKDPKFEFEKPCNGWVFCYKSKPIP